MHYLHLCPWTRATAICIIHGHFALLSGDIHSRRLPCGSCYVAPYYEWVDGAVVVAWCWFRGLFGKDWLPIGPCSRGFFPGKVGVGVHWFQGWRVCWTKRLSVFVTFQRVFPRGFRCFQDEVFQVWDRRSLFRRIIEFSWFNFSFQSWMDEK